MSGDTGNPLQSGRLKSVIACIALFACLALSLLYLARPKDSEDAEERKREQQIAALERENGVLRHKLEALRAEARAKAAADSGANVTPHATPLPAPREGARASAAPSPAPESSPEGDESETTRQAVRRVGLVQKFLNLSPEDAARLEAYYQDHEGNGMPEVLADGIEKALGKEQADSYRDRVRDAFSKAEDEDDEKEVLFLSRKLTLSGDQEEALRAATREAAALGAGTGVPHQANDAAALQKYLDTLKGRRALIDQRMHAVLSAEQYQAYSEYQATSAEQDLELLHGPAATPQK